MPDLIDVLTSEVTELYYEVNSLKDFVEKQQNLISFEPTAVNNDNQHLENLIYLVEVIRTNLKNIKIELFKKPNIQAHIIAFKDNLKGFLINPNALPVKPGFDHEVIKLKYLLNLVLCTG